MPNDSPTSMPVIDLGSPVYAAMRSHYAELLSRANIKAVSRKTPVIDRLIRSASDAYARGDCPLAAELFTIATETDNLSELAFFGTGLTSFELNRTGVARANFVQGRVLHDAVGPRDHLTLYDDMIAGLAGFAGEVPEEDAAPAPYIPPDERNRWYLKYARRHPKRGALRDTNDFDGYFFDGLTPPAPIIQRSDQIATIGSCFAENMSRALAKQGSNHLPIDDTFFTTYALREAFEYAFGGNEARAHWRQGSDRETADGASSHPHSPNYSIDTARTALGHGDAYIVTLGLAEIWYNRKTDAVYPSGLNIDAFDPDEHGFRVSSLEENLANIEAIYDLIRNNRGPVPIIFTLSPIPLAATFRDINCVAANSVSKAILRLAIDRLVEEHRDDENLFYFPSYEIVREYFVDPFIPDMRHVKTNIIHFVVEQFLRKFMIAGS